MRRMPIGSLADVTAGQGAPKPDEFSDDGIPFVRAGSLEDLIAGKKESELELVPLDTAKKCKLKLYPKGSILFAKSGMSATKDRIYVLQNPAYVVSHLAILTSKDSVHRDYLRLALKQFPPSRLIKDPAYPAIGLGEIQGYEVPVPDEFNDQIRIAHLLSNVEGLIAQRKQNLEQLDDLLKSVFLEMFGDPVRNEKGWDVDFIGKSIKVQGGFAFKSKDITSNGPIKLVKIANVHFENLTWDEVSYVPASFIEEHNKFSLRKGDLLIALTRPVIKSLNVVKMAIVQKEDLPCLLNQRVARFLIDQNQINKRFFLQYCYTEFFRNTVEGLCPPGLQPNVSTTQIEDIKLFYPPTELQNEFAAVANKVEALKSRYKQSLNYLESLYSALSQQAFKGELDISKVPLSELEQKTEEVATTAAKSDEQAVDKTIAFLLPERDILLDVLTDKEKRDDLLAFWLESYCQQIVNKPFSASDFLAAAQTRIAELHPDNDFELGLDDYDQIKHWVFKALNSKRLQQAQNVTGQDEQGEPILGNLIELKVGIKL